MKDIYLLTATTKQNIQQRYNRYLHKQEEAIMLEMMIHKVRSDHPKMGAEKLYVKLSPHVGRDRFYNLYRLLGFTIEKQRNYKRTTQAGALRFDNLIANMKVTGVNQIWVSDITYFDLGKKFAFITFIMDQYSRFIVGYHASERLLTSHTTIPALQMAMHYYKPSDNHYLHSDGGGQYYNKEFLELTNNRLVNSMGRTVYENPYAERINGIIKIEYLNHWAPKTLTDLRTRLKKAVNNYNFERPHRSLNFKAPAQISNIYQQIKNKKLSLNNQPNLVNSI